jgi:hypothetical protein
MAAVDGGFCFGLLLCLSGARGGEGPSMMEVLSAVQVEERIRRYRTAHVTLPRVLTRR